MTSAENSTDIEKHPFDRLSLKRQSLWIAVGSVITGLILAVISSQLPAEEAAKRMATRIFGPLLTLNYSDQGQSAITVLTIDDLDLQAYDLTWPLPLDFYQRALDRVAAHQPKSIFLDILFLDNRADKPGIDKLRQSVCRASDAGIRMYLATMERASGTEGKQAQHPASNVERTLLEARNSADKPCIQPVLANITPDQLDQSQWEYPLVQPGGEGRSSVALGLYCDMNPAGCPAHADVPLALIWGTKAVPSNEQTMVERVADGRLASLCRSTWHWWEAVPGLTLFESLAFKKTEKPLCPYHQVLPLRAFQGYGFTGEQLQGLLHEKTVMVGADLAGLGDNVISPFHGRLPGVHVHAMALDNLIETQGNYYENGEFLHHGWISRTNVFTLVALVLISTVLALMHRRTHHQSGAAHRHPHPQEAVRALPAAQKGGWLNCLRHHLLWVVAVFPALLAIPGTDQKIVWPKFAKEVTLGLLVYAGMPLLLLLLGFVFLRQGPLVIIEYVMFPLLAHFFHLGEIFARRVCLWCASRKQPSFWTYMGRINARNSSEH